MSTNIRALQSRKANEVKGARALTDKATLEARDLSAEEQATFDKHSAVIGSLNASIDREQMLAQEEASLPTASVITVTENAAADPKRGFNTFGEFAMAVKTAGVDKYASLDKRLAIGAAVPGGAANEGSGADGGFTIPPQFASTIFQLSLLDDAFLPMTDQTTVGGNGMVFPKDETTPWGTNGVRAYWQAEATAATATKPVFGTQAMRLHKLMALAPVTNELLDDSAALGSYLAPLMGRSITWKTNEAIMFGTGAGQPLGLFTNAGNAGSCAIVQAKEAGQATATVNVNNVANMIARLIPGSYAKSYWLITPDLLPALFTMTLGNYPIYLPASAGVQGNPYGTLLGRPIIVSQHAPAFSSQGDISLIDFSYYRTITKASGVAIDQSMHLYFDADATAFRATFRLDGGAKIAAPITQAKGSKTLSPFIQLAAR